MKHAVIFCTQSVRGTLEFFVSSGGDGIVTCGPTTIYTAPFAYDGGCSRWAVEGETCRPVARP